MSFLFYIGRFVNVIFYPLGVLNPVLSVLMITLCFTFFNLLLRKKFLDTQKIKDLKREIEEIREKLLKKREKSEELINKLMSLNLTVLKYTSRMFFISLILGILCFSWIYYNYSLTYIRLPFSVFSLKNLNIIYFYLILTFIISIVISKLLEVS